MIFLAENLSNTGHAENNFSIIHPDINNLDFTQLWLTWNPCNKWRREPLTIVGEGSSYKEAFLDAAEKLSKLMQSK